MALKLGLTGGIGAGKSLVASIFAVLNVPIYYADDQAKRLMIEDLQLKQEIVEALSLEAYHPDGSLNRGFIADKVFRDPFLLSRLNGLVHPRVAADHQQWHSRHSHCPYTIEEAALLFESGGYLHMDAVLHVHAESSIRVNRVMKRDGVDRNSALNRMENQWPEDRRLMLADFTVYNDGTRMLIPQVFALHERFHG